MFRYIASVTVAGAVLLKFERARYGFVGYGEDDEVG